MRRILLLLLCCSTPLAAQQPVRPMSGPVSLWHTGTYQYDGAGNIVAVGDDAYTYDKNQRLATSSINAAGQTLARTYGYDVYGNMTSYNNPSTTLATTSVNHLSGLSATYDAGGNLTQLQPPGNAYTYSYKYDAMNMTRELTIGTRSPVIHIYTADDERIWTYDTDASVNRSTYRLRDFGNRVVREITVTGTSWSSSRDYFHRDAQLLGAVSNAGAEHYTLDHLGTPRLITNVSGAQIGFHTYYPFGDEITTAQQEGSPVKFTGHERDAEIATGTSGALDYMHARHSNPALGRFLSVDPSSASSDVAEPQSWNRYAYALNTPINAVDPDGRASYRVNRDIGQNTARSKWNPFTHTFVATYSNGVLFTASWGNEKPSLYGHFWNINQPEDLKAAADAIKSGDAEKVGDDSLDPYIRIALARRQRFEPDAGRHWNLGIIFNCKQEAYELILEAQQLKREADRKKKEEEERKRKLDEQKNGPKPVTSG